MGLNINWGKSVDNAVGVVIAAIVLGACAIVWQGVASMDSRIRASEYRLQATIEVVDRSTKNLASDMEKNHKVHEENHVENSVLIKKIIAMLENDVPDEKIKEELLKSIGPRAITPKIHMPPNSAIYNIQEQVQQKIMEK